MNIEIINLLLNNGFHLVFIAIIFLIWHIIKNIEQYLSIYQTFKNRKINLLEEAINYPKMPDMEKNRLIELKVNELYCQATGLNVDAKIQPLALKLIDEFSLNEHKINSIRHYLTIHQGQIQIDITKIEWCFLFISKWIFWLLSIVIAIIIIFSIMFIDIIRNDVDALNSILQLFFISFFIGLIYAGEARKYNIFCKIYESNCSIFKARTPNLYWKIGSITLCFIIISTNIYIKI